MQINLVEQPNKHPWYQSDLRNSLIPIIHQKFYSRQKYLQSHSDMCEIHPAFNFIFDEDIHNNFLKLIRTLIDNEINFYLCVGNENKLSVPNNYTFQCNCNSQLSPVLINECDDWLHQIDVLEKYYPKNISDFESNLSKAIGILNKINFSDKPILYDYKFTDQFKREVIRVNNHKAEILLAITKKLILTANESRHDRDLQDEYITQKKEYRIRVTGRPYSKRINYILDENKIQFIHYYDEGEHDKGL